MSRVVSVVLPLPLQSAFSYRAPDEVPLPGRGARVVVPFGARRLIGVVTGPGQAAPGVALKDLVRVLDATPLVPEPLLDLAAWIADYYLAPPGECFRLVLPPAGSALATSGFRTVRVATLVEPAPGLRGKAQREVIERLRRAGGSSRVPDLARDRPGLRAALLKLAEGGLVRLSEQRETRHPQVLPGGKREPVLLSTEQSPIVESLAEGLAKDRFECALLHGVTGSGKTEIYFRAVETALAAGRSALLLVPEIALTPLLVRAAVARFGQTVSVLHSELSAGERHDQWWRIRDGESRLVVGARSAVFAPLRELGLIVVDEEHEAAYKQEESPRYHARDVAVMRGKLEGALVVLGSATPSLESYNNAKSGKYRLFSLPSRVTARGLPGVEIVDRRSLLRSGGDAILTPSLVEALRSRLARREQSLLLLNRRGYATSLLCRECGEQAVCPNCSVALTVHEAGRSIECHYCGYSSRTPAACASCRGEYLRLTGHGTEKVVEAVRAVVPKARVERLDRDLARRRGALARVLADFESGATDVLVGTQMIAKGHDFPRVTLVGVVDADVGLGLPDFRSAERTFQLLTQVAGRAGRAELKGEVILQSLRPDHYALQLACAQDYPSFFEREMEFRRAMGYPPSTALVNVILRSRQMSEAARAARALAARLRTEARGRYRVLGPAFAPLARLRREHRCQVLLKGQRSAMRAAVKSALGELYGGTRWRGVAVDVDPLSLM